IGDPAWSDFPAVAEEGHQVRGAVEPCVLHEVSETHRIELASIHSLGHASNRDRQREVADSREEVHDDRARTDPLCYADSLRDVARGEHHTGHVQCISYAAFGVQRISSMPPQDSNIRNAHRPAAPGNVLYPVRSAPDR